MYTGQWYNDTINGKGVMEYKNGDRFDGEWNCGQVFCCYNYLACLSDFFPDRNYLYIEI